MIDDNISSRILNKCMPNSKAHNVKSEKSIVDKLGFGKKSKVGKAGEEFLKKLGTKKNKKIEKIKRKGSSKKKGHMAFDMEKYVGKRPNFEL